MVYWVVLIFGGIDKGLILSVLVVFGIGLNLGVRLGLNEATLMPDILLVFGDPVVVSGVKLISMQNWYL